jgi:hypothetical protein
MPPERHTLLAALAGVSRVKLYFLAHKLRLLRKQNKLALLPMPSIDVPAVASVSMPATTHSTRARGRRSLA